MKVIGRCCRSSDRSNRAVRQCIRNWSYVYLYSPGLRRGAQHVCMGRWVAQAAGCPPPSPLSRRACRLHAMPCHAMPCHGCVGAPACCRMECTTALHSVSSSLPRVSHRLWEGDRTHGAGCRMQGAECTAQDAGCRVQDARRRMQDAECRVQSAGCRVQDARWPPSAAVQHRHPSPCRARIHMGAPGSPCSMHQHIWDAFFSVALKPIKINRSGACSLAL